jgi:hypothetical protein
MLLIPLRFNFKIELDILIKFLSKNSRAKPLKNHLHMFYKMKEWKETKI